MDVERSGYYESIADHAVEMARGAFTLTGDRPVDD